MIRERHTGDQMTEATNIKDHCGAALLVLKTTIGVAEGSASEVVEAAKKLQYVLIAKLQSTPPGSTPATRRAVQTLTPPWARPAAPRPRPCAPSLTPLAWAPGLRNI